MDTTQRVRGGLLAILCLAIPATTVHADEQATGLYGRGEAVYMTLSRDGDGQPLVLDDILQRAVLDTGDLEYEYETGAGGAVGYQFQNWALEGSYYALDWQSQAGVEDVNNLNLAGDLALASFDYFLADTVAADSTAELHNAEFKLVTTEPGLALMAGLRYLHFEDSLNLNFTDFDTGTSDFHVESRNKLFGPQAGLQWRGEVGRFEWQIWGTAGIFPRPDAKQRTTVRDFDNTILLRNATAKDLRNEPYFLEAGADGVWLLTRNIALRGGYRVLCIRDIAVAHEQLDFSDSPESSTLLGTGDVLLHGALAGVELRW